MKVTRSDGNHLLELDGRPALDVWLEMVGRETSTNNVDDSAAWAIGLRQKDSGTIDGEELWTIMAAFGFDPARKSVILQASVPEDVEVMFHHRTVEAVSKGTVELAARMRAQLNGALPIAALGFECAARTGPFLGVDETRRENCQLQETLAPNAAWLGLAAWGEVAPSPVKVAFCNYTFPVLLLTEGAATH